MQGTAQIKDLDLLLQGDSMTIWIDPASQMMRRVEITTIYEKKPATLVIEYRSVPNGPTSAARTVQVQKVLDEGRKINQAVARGSYGAEAARLWAVLRTGINDLARAYGVPPLAI